METWIRRACRQRSYLTFITWVLLSIGVVALNIGAKDYWANFFQGPYGLSLTNLESLHYPDPARQFVTVEGTKIVPSGIQVITIETKNGVKQREYASSDYYVLVVGQRLLAINAHQQPSLKVTGELKPMPVGLQKMIFPDQADAALREAILPLLLDNTDDYRVSGYFCIGAMALFAFLFWRFGVRAFKRTQDITLHPVVQRVEGWADAVEATMEAEREQTHAIRFKKAGVVITDNYVIVRSLYGFDLLPLNHLVWAYRKATTRMVNFIPVARTSTAELVFYGGSVSLQARKKVVEEILYYVAARTPWAFIGYTDQLNNAFKKNPAEFSNAVEERKAQLAQR